MAVRLRHPQRGHERRLRGVRRRGGGWTKQAPRAGARSGGLPHQPPAPGARRHPPRLAAALLARTAARRAPVALHRPVAHQRALRDHRRVGGYPRRPLRPPPAATGDHPQRHPLSLVARYLMPKVIREKGYDRLRWMLYALGPGAHDRLTEGVRRTPCRLPRQGVRRTGRAVSPRGLCPCRFRLLARAGPAGDLGTVPTHSCLPVPWEGVPRGNSRHAAWTRCQALEPAWGGVV